MASNMVAIVIPHTTKIIIVKVGDFLDLIISATTMKTKKSKSPLRNGCLLKKRETIETYSIKVVWLDPNKLFDSLILGTSECNKYQTIPIATPIGAIGYK